MITRHVFPIARDKHQTDPREREREREWGGGGGGGGGEIKRGGGRGREGETDRDGVERQRDQRPVVSRLRITHHAFLIK